jgi:tetratricopeptide (TPR) repeat protein
MKNANTRHILLCTTLFLAAGVSADGALGQEPPKPAARPPIPGQLAQDFVAGRPPREEEILAAEKDVAADPSNLALVRRLGKGYFFRFFGAGNAAAVPKAQATFDRALELKRDDPETLAYNGALWTFIALRLDKTDPAKQKADFDKGFELLQRAEKLAPHDGAVTSVTAGSYVELPDSYGMAPHVVEMLETMRKGMGPMFDRFSDHGRQRLLLTLGRAYARTGQTDKARANFDEALKANQTSSEADLLRTELAKLVAKH